MNAKPTKYGNVWFRSGLEAKWAATFDTFGIRWEYERAQLELVSGRYIPDFWLPQYKWWVEVKPDLQSAEIGRYKEVVDLERRPFLVIIDEPKVGVYKLRYIRGGRNSDLMGQFAQMYNGSQLWIADKSRAAPISYPGLLRTAPPGLTLNSKFIVDKMNLAKQRFDH